MKRKYLIVSLVVSVLAATTVSGCGLFSGTNRGFPYPEGWVVEDEEGDGAGTDSEEKKEAGSAVGRKTESGDDRTEKKKAGKDDAKTKDVELKGGNGNGSSSSDPALQEKPKAVYLLDISGSMNREPEVNDIHMAAERACPGFQQEYYALDEKGPIITIDPEAATSGRFNNKVGAILDVLGEKPIPITADGINILTTDIQTGTASSKIGIWLADTRSESFSFYVFSLNNSYNVDFFEYTSSTVKEKVTITDCKIKRDFLMVVFGKDSLVRKFDKEFSDRFHNGIEYEQIHILRGDLAKSGESLVKLSPSRHFTDNFANITYDLTRFLFGVRPKDTGNTIFSWANTFVFKRSKKSANSNENAAKVIAYGIPKNTLPKITNQQVTVLEYDEKKKSFVESNVVFDVFFEQFQDGIPAADDPGLNDKLGGNLVGAGKPAILITVENKHLPKKLYAVEAVLTCKGEKKEKDFKAFARRHSAGLEEYRAALKTECVPLGEPDGSKSKNRYKRTAEGDSSTYSRLLEFERIADELDAASYVTDAGERAITLRSIIDFR